MPDHKPADHRCIGCGATYDRRLAELSRWTCVWCLEAIAAPLKLVTDA